jgi:CspA family cold shock protein
MKKQGYIKFFKFDKCYGFIVPEEGGRDVMLHIGVCQDCGYMPQHGGKVLYETERTPTGLKATWVGGVPD